MIEKPERFLEHDEFCVRLGFMGDDLDPDELTRLLGAPPTYAHRRGDALRRRSYPIAVGGYWAISTERSTCDIEEQVTALFARLTSDLAVWRDLTSRFKADLFCGVFIAWSGHGFSMSPSLHRALADRNLLIIFDIYPEYDRNA
jgi:hypothetical protein